MTGNSTLNKQTFICFGDDLIDYGLYIPCAFPRHQLPIRAGAFAHNPLDVLDLALVAKLLHFSGDKFEHLVEQIALVYFAFAAEIDQFAVESVSARAPPIFIDQTLRIIPKSYV